jgi:NUP50 (Nucleoporin 50 kDa)
MSKRGPTSELNHDNWDKEDADKESAGEFKQADNDEMKKRVILQAKRKSASSSGSDAAVNMSLNACKLRFLNTV